MPKQVMVRDGKKLIWDGVDYADSKEASATMEKCKGEGFDVESSEEDGKIYLYTRRVVKEVAVQNS